MDMAKLHFMPEGHSMSVLQPHEEIAGSADARHFIPQGLAAQSAGVVHPQIVCDWPIEQCGPRGLVAHSPSAEQ
jgi:hypothetical protein